MERKTETERSRESETDAERGTERARDRHTDRGGGAWRESLESQRLFP